jgi:hypothetical protein
MLAKVVARGLALIVMVGVVFSGAVPASADPESDFDIDHQLIPVASSGQQVVDDNTVNASTTPVGSAAVVGPTTLAAEADAGPSVDNGIVASAPPVTTKTPDGWTLTVSAKDETQLPIPPLTTALSSRAYAVGGTFTASLKGAGETPKGVLEVGYQIGCGILANEVGLNGSVGAAPGFVPAAVIPFIVGAYAAGSVSVNLAPGTVTAVSVYKQDYTSTDPWVKVDNVQIGVDTCVGQSFIRSYAKLSKVNKDGAVVLSWYGVTKSF